MYLLLKFGDVETVRATSLPSRQGNATINQDRVKEVPFPGARLLRIMNIISIGLLDAHSAKKFPSKTKIPNKKPITSHKNRAHPAVGSMPQNLSIAQWSSPSDPPSSAQYSPIELDPMGRRARLAPLLQSGSFPMGATNKQGGKQVEGEDQDTARARSGRGAGERKTKRRRRRGIELDFGDFGPKRLDF